MHITATRPAARSDAAIAVWTPEGSLTHRELDSWSNRLARVLLRAGVRRGSVVAVAVEPLIEDLVTRTAIAKIGATAVPAGTRVPAPAFGVTTEDARDGLGEPIPWLVLDDRSTLLRYLTGSDAPLTEAELDGLRPAC
ncbi:MAG TPA: AMP-binding protein [Nocardia sp.]|uniref:AMP-binding protein n=1 Tax=Nocardia TaxID=1817 RepID=UPI0024577232|nr:MULTISPECIES: AMP-binding protein [Nocardia]HLS76079.1 AMP-binding protein [Nocardia sp.]